MGSRAGLVVILILLTLVATGPATSQPPIGVSLYTVRVDPRLCPSPLCGGYWVMLANNPQTRCADGTRTARCYVAKAVDEDRHPLAMSVPDGALVRAVIESWKFEGVGELGVLAVAVVYSPAGRTPAIGSYQRLVDTGIRCVRAPCFSYRATRLNGSVRTALSGIDLGAARADATEVGRAEAALHTKNGLLARGRFVTGSDGGRVFRAARLFLRTPQPRA
jgi:hypothetical protein